MRYIRYSKLTGDEKADAVKHINGESRYRPKGKIARLL